MAESVAIDRAPATKPATVSASALALHLDCSRTYIGTLEAEGVIQRQGGGYSSTSAALPICDTCGASGGNRHARRLTLIISRSRLNCCTCG